MNEPLILSEYNSIKIVRYKVPKKYGMDDFISQKEEQGMKFICKIAETKTYDVLDFIVGYPKYST